MGKFGAALLVIGTAWIIFVFGYGAFLLLRSIPNTKWIQAAPPPEPLASLKLGSDLSKLAEGKSGTLYHFTMYPNYVWEKATAPSANPSETKDCKKITDNTFNPPGKVKSRIGASCGYAESTFHSELALLENGEVWYLESVDNSYVTLGRIFVVILMPIAALPGALVVLIGLILIFIKVIRDKSL